MELSQTHIVVATDTFPRTSTSAYYLLQLPIKSIALVLVYRIGTASSVKAHVYSNRNTNILLHDFQILWHLRYWKIVSLLYIQYMHSLS